MANNTLHEPLLETFTRFPDLPPEIRHQIWRYMLPGPRVVHIVGSSRPNGGQCFVDATDNPLLLRICQESRTVARERYQLSFEPHLQCPVYFDFSSDILLMQDEKVLSMFFERSKGPITSEVTRVKAIAVGMHPQARVISLHVISQFLFVMGIYSAMVHAASRFGNLGEIILLTTGGLFQPDFENRLRSNSFRTRMEKSYTDDQDPYALKRREFLKDEDGNIPTTKLMTVVDFWNRFS
ncbi:hypothetical protein N431DRAFT_464128 [Stipitochalara longipes BDJ]|nr:hypothetical protein N431DRAFT_464128 [Stipitochalara longipes BDJ]